MFKLPKFAAKAAISAVSTDSHASGAFVASAAAEPHVLGQWFAHVDAHRPVVPPQSPRVAVNIVVPKPQRQVRFAPLPPKRAAQRSGRPPTIRIVDGVLEVGDDCAFGFSFSVRHEDE